MLPRVLILLVAVGLAAVDATGYNNDGYNQGYPRDNNRYGNNPNYNPSNNQDYNNQRYNPGYDQNYNPSHDRNSNRNYNQQYNGYRDRGSNNVYTKNETAIFCYVNGTRLGRSSYTPDASLNMFEIDVRSCTHLIVGAAMIHPNSYTMQPISEEFLREGNGKLSFNNLSEFKKENPNLKLLVSISGSSETFSMMARSPQSRLQFVTSVYEFISKYNGLGVNIDWQWPGGRDRADEIDNYFLVLKELKQKIRAIPLTLPSSSHDLTIFVPPERQQISMILMGAERNAMNEYIDYYILMALELRGHNYQKIEHHAPIDSYISAQTVRKAIDDVRSHVPREFYYKFILAIPFYGKRYQLEARNTYDSPMHKPFVRQHTTYRDTLIAPYSQVCRELADREYRYGYDQKNESPYAVHDTTVYVYEDTESVRAKTRLALQSGFGGVMAYSIEMDDVSGQCGTNRRLINDRNTHNSYANSYSDNKFPLLHAIYDQVQRGNAALFHSSPLAIAFAVVCAMVLKVNN